MLNDTLTCEQDEVSFAADLCCHIKALADERDRLLEGYRQMTQIVSSRHQWHYKVAQAILEGADLRNMEECEILAAKWAKKT